MPEFNGIEQNAKFRGLKMHFQHPGLLPVIHKVLCKFVSVWSVDYQWQCTQWSSCDPICLL